WHRVREGYKTEGLEISNRLRGLLAEFGIVMAQGDRALRIALADLVGSGGVRTGESSNGYGRSLDTGSRPTGSPAQLGGPEVQLTIRVS
ncbi:hypothetical protein B1A_19680, partial [mine drainage metagenome]